MNGAHCLAANRRGITKWLRAAVVALIAIAVVYSAWLPFVQLASIEIRYTAAVAIADYLLEAPPRAPASPGYVPALR